MAGSADSDTVAPGHDPNPAARQAVGGVCRVSARECMSNIFCCADLVKALVGVMGKRQWSISAPTWPTRPSLIHHLTKLAVSTTPRIGAIHQIAAHFTIHDDPAVITMPTGSGKTAVLMMSPFVLRASRVLVLTPSRLVREQITEDFRSLETLRKAHVIPDAVPSPKVFELKEQVDSASRWEALRQFDVVVATPNVASPAYDKIPPPPEDLFDLILIDEAHHARKRPGESLFGPVSRSHRALHGYTVSTRSR